MASSRSTASSLGALTTGSEPTSVSGPRLHKRVARDGLEIASLKWGEPQSSVLVCLVHATGFCKEVCIPVVDDLLQSTSGLRAIAIDQRGHGDSGLPQVPLDWWDGAGDILELVDEEAAPAIGVGHSAGGAQLLMAEMARPGTFAGFVLVEPIVFPPPYGRFPDNPMSAAARRRRDRFESRQAAFDNWKGKPAFAAWEDRALWAYVDGGLRPDESGYVLKCARDIEAETFIAATDHRAWERLGEVEVDTLVIAGEHSTTHPEAFLAEMTGRMPRARFEIVPDTSHLVWMERPGLIAAHIARVAGLVS